MSAGFIGPGRPAPAEAQTTAIRRGIDLSRHRSVLITEELVGSADLIVVMEPAQRNALLNRFWIQGRIIVLGDLDPLPIEQRAVRDPFGESEDVFRDSYERIDRCIDQLLSVLQVPATHRATTLLAHRHQTELSDRPADHIERIPQ